MLRTTMGLLLVLAAAAVGAAERSVEEMVVTAKPDRRTIELDETVGIAPDSATLLRKAVGANVVSNGPITGMAQYRGMSRFRVSSRIDGGVISPGGPNWMDPPLSYAPAAHLDTLEVYRGIAPVSAGQETIGGVVNARTWTGEFAESDTVLSGRARVGSQSVNNASLVSSALVLASPTQRFKVSGLTEQADDGAFPGGKVRPSEYQRQRYDAGYSLRRGPHTVSVNYGRSDTGDAGTPALAMDIRNIDADLYRLDYEFSGERFSLTARAYGSDIDHGMSNYHLRPPPASLAAYRRNITDARNRGFAIELRTGDWTVGIDGHDETHNSDIDNPNNPGFFVRSFADAGRRIVGAYVEHRFTHGNDWSLELGARLNQVHSDADTVDATPASMGMPPAVALRDAFNDADRSRRDRNVDWVVKAYRPAGERTVWYAGLARKSRSPAYQERYLWLPLQATAGLADGRTYTGNPDLDPEVAHEIELGFDWNGERSAIAPRFYYRHIDDYIQGIPSTNPAAISFVAMMNGPEAPPPLEFHNVDAVFYGVDVDWRYRLNQQWALHGVINVVRGERDDRDDDLYRLAPANAVVELTYHRRDWEFAVEALAYAAQNKVSAVNGEQPTAGYAVWNIKGQWSITDGLKLGFGVDNLADREYADHLAGTNRVLGNPDLASGQRLPGFGRNAFARLDVVW